MTIKYTVGLIGKEMKQAGQIEEVPYPVGQRLINLGRAVEVEPEKPKAPPKAPPPKPKKRVKRRESKRRRSTRESKDI